eukprot:5042274-Pleurochrysis_carterae.AAC.2
MRTGRSLTIKKKRPITTAGERLTVYACMGYGSCGIEGAQNRRRRKISLHTAGEIAVTSSSK